MAINWIYIFCEWLEAHRSALAQDRISLDIPPATQGLSPNSIYADMRSKRYEWTAQLWDNGLSDFQFLDWENMDAGVETTHYQFGTKEELFSALEAMLKRMQSTAPDDMHENMQTGNKC